MFSLGTTLTAFSMSLAAFALAGANPTITISKLNQTVSPVQNFMPAMAKHLPVQHGEDGRMYMNIDINGNVVKVIVDTAASHSVLSARDAKLASIKAQGTTKIVTAAGQSDAQIGIADSIQVVENKLSNHRILIVEDLPVSILGVDVLKKMNGYYISF